MKKIAMSGNKSYILRYFTIAESLESWLHMLKIKSKATHILTDVKVVTQRS